MPLAVTSTMEELVMDNQTIAVFGDILSGKDVPQRIVFEKTPTDDESGFIVDCGRLLETKMSVIGKSLFLDSHPELREVLARMQVGDVAVREDTTSDPQWRIKNNN